MMTNIMALISLAGTAITGGALALFVHANADVQAHGNAEANAQANAAAKAQLDQDLIHAKVNLEGWQKENTKGNLVSADYRSAFATDLGSLRADFESDARAL